MEILPLQVGKGTRTHVSVVWFVVRNRRQHSCENDMFAICKHFIFTWIPSHIGIHGNRVVHLVSNCYIPYRDFIPFIIKYISKLWQDSRDQQIHNKLHDIHYLVGKTPCSYGQNRKEQVVWTRCRIWQIDTQLSIKQ